MIYTIDTADNKKVEELLKENNVKFETYDTPIELFCTEESKYRIEQFEESYGEKFNEDSVNKIDCKLVNRLYDENENFIDGDYLYNVANEVIDKFITDNNGNKIFMVRE